MFIIDTKVRWFCLWRCIIMSFIYVPYQIQVITCNKLITEPNAIIQRNISHVTWHHGKEMCPDCSLPDCHIACLPTTFGGNPVKSNEILQCLYQIKENRILFIYEVRFMYFFIAWKKFQFHVKYHILINDDCRTFHFQNIVL